VNSIAVFTYTNKEIRTIVIDGEIWFVAKDVCDLLEIVNTRDAMSRLPDSMKGVATTDTLGGPQEMNTITEAGLYKLAFTSRKEQAEAFTDFVAGTILPTIRKTGHYSIKPMTSAEMLAAQAQLMVDLEKRQSAVEQIASQTVTRIQQMAEAVTSPISDNWKDDMNSRINELCMKYGLNYQSFRGELYMMLENQMHCNLKARVTRKADRMRQAGYKYAEARAVTKLDVIADDRGLRAAFETIVRQNQFKYHGDA
jgi:prophage antirepressor-like protein